MSISEATIQNILSRVDIIDVIGESVRLIKSGRNYKARCPFHNEKTPSFYVNQEKQIYHCFGCNTGGNAIGFLMKMEGLTYPEAIRKLANKCNIEIKETNYGVEDNFSKERETIYKILEDAGTFYQKLLAENNAIKSWLKKRGINEETIEKFRIGYAPSSAKTLYNAAVKKGYSPEILYKAGIVSTERDFFYNRIIFPIFDITGRIIAFGGRVVDDNIQPKYLNTPETMVYSKSKVLYGLNFAGRSIREANTAVVLEGYIDVIMCHQYGVTNTMATLGTAFSLQHSSILKRYTDNIIVAYDPDTAGRSSALRSCEILLADDLCVKVAELPNGKDSDEILLSDGVEKLREVYSNSKSYIDFLVNEKSKTVDIKSVEGKREITKFVLPVISKIPNEIVKSEYIKILSERLGIKEEILNSEIRKIKQSVGEVKPDKVHVKSSITLTERNLISTLIGDLKLVDLLSEITADDFKSAEIKDAYNLLLRLRSEGKTAVTPAELVEMGCDNFITQILIKDNKIEDSEEFVNSYREAVLLKNDKKNLEGLKGEDLSEFIKASKKIKGSKR